MFEKKNRAEPGAILCPADSLATLTSVFFSSEKNMACLFRRIFC